MRSRRKPPLPLKHRPADVAARQRSPCGNFLDFKRSRRCSESKVKGEAGGVNAPAGQGAGWGMAGVVFYPASAPVGSPCPNVPPVRVYHRLDKYVERAAELTPSLIGRAAPSSSRAAPADRPTWTGASSLLALLC